LQQNEILGLLTASYGKKFDQLTFVRDGGSVSYEVTSAGQRYFLRAVKPAFLDTAIRGTDVHVFLQQQNFPVVPIILTAEQSPYLRVQDSDGDHLYLLYEFVEGGEAHPEKDAAEAGALIGQFHHLMQSYPGTLVSRERHYFIDRYLEILKKKRYPRVAEFEALGNQLWGQVKDLPRGFCHGDMYCGNVHKTPAGRFYILDFDTAADAFPMFDIALFCNMTDYFNFEAEGYSKSKVVLDRFLPAYAKYHTLTQAEIDAFFNLIGVYHFQLQATIIELFGPDCVDEAFFEGQLDWLHKWVAQSKEA
jgi:Ser/Thr protein kinase RdoA (MazF antagonist)